MNWKACIECRLLLILEHVKYVFKHPICKGAECTRISPHSQGFCCPFNRLIHINRFSFGRQHLYLSLFSQNVRVAVYTCLGKCKTLCQKFQKGLFRRSVTLLTNVSVFCAACGGYVCWPVAG